MDSRDFSLEWTNLSLWRGERCLQADLSGCLTRGQALTLRGPNGCGKTTLLRTLCGLTLPESGTIRWQGEALGRVRADYYAHMAYCGHSNGLKGELTTRENLAFAARMRSAHIGQDELLQGLNLVHCADLPVRNLSAGQRRRASLAMVLASGTEVWVLDEPFTNLDSAGCAWLGRRLNTHLTMGGLLLIAAHQASLIDPDKETLLELAGVAA
jgi:heme exporter protein A